MKRILGESLKTVLSVLDNVENLGDNRYRASCPAHRDKRSSLKITIKDKIIRIRCYGGCRKKKILSRLIDRLVYKC